MHLINFLFEYYQIYFIFFFNCTYILKIIKNLKKILYLKIFIKIKKNMKSKNFIALIYIVIIYYLFRRGRSFYCV